MWPLPLKPDAHIPTLHIYMGLPASGKTTAALDQAASTGALRICKDDLRLSNPPPDGKWSLDYERNVVIPEESRLILAGLRAGHDVIVDSTNFAHERRLRRLAYLAGADACVRFFDTPLDICIERDAQRIGSLHKGEKVIRAMADAYRDQILYKTVTPVVQPLGRRMLIADLDGTLAIPNGRPVRDLSRCGEDRVCAPIRELIHGFYLMNGYYLFLTARSEEWRVPTMKWLTEQARLSAYTMLVMRARGDMRRDTEVKLDLFDQYVRGRFPVEIVLEDRTRCVQLWRALGLTCLQVSDGDY